MAITSQQQANLVAYLVANPTLCTSSAVGTVVSNLGPVAVPVTTPFNYVSMAKDNSLGVDATKVIFAAIQAAIAAGSTDAALYDVALRSSDGIDPTDSQFPSKAAIMVGSGILTSAQLLVLTQRNTDPAGCGFPASDDVTAAIPTAQRVIAINALRALAQADYQTNLLALNSTLQGRIGKCDQLSRDTSTVPTTLADLDADTSP